MKITKNLSLSEFEKSDTAAKLKINNKAPESVHKSIIFLAETVIQPLCDILDAKVLITSGYRSKALNDAIPGAVETSQHRLGEAGDCMFYRVENNIPQFIDPIMVAKCAIDNNIPYDQMGVYPTFTHLSARDGRTRRMIFYSKSYTGNKL